MTPRFSDETSCDFQWTRESEPSPRSPAPGTVWAQVNAQGINGSERRKLLSLCCFFISTRAGYESKRCTALTNSVHHRWPELSHGVSSCWGNKWRFWKKKKFGHSDVSKLLPFLHLTWHEWEEKSFLPKWAFSSKKNSFTVNHCCVFLCSQCGGNAASERQRKHEDERPGEKKEKKKDQTSPFLLFTSHEWRRRKQPHSHNMHLKQSVCIMWKCSLLAKWWMWWGKIETVCVWRQSNPRNSLYLSNRKNHLHVTTCYNWKTARVSVSSSQPSLMLLRTWHAKKSPGAPR